MGAPYPIYTEAQLAAYNRRALADEIARAAVWEAKGFPQLVNHGSWIWQWPIPYWQCVAYARGFLAADAIWRNDLNLRPGP